MADPISIVQSIISLLVTINNMVATFDNNQEDCGRIRTLVGTAQAVVEPLKHTLKIMENKGMSAALKGLEEALERSRKVVESCSGKKKNAISRAIQANGIAGDLRRVYEDISTNLVLVVLANGINNNSMLADIMEILADLRARDADAYGSMLAKILEIIAAHPDVHLRQEVETLVHTYHNSTEYSTSRSEVKSEKENVRAADMKAPCASLSDGSAKSTPVKRSIGQGGPSTVSKDSSHSSNQPDGAGSSKEKKNKIKKIDGPNTTRPEIKTEKTNVLADSKGPCASSPDGTAKSTSVNGQGGPNIVNKARSSSSKLVDGAQSVAVSAAPSQLQKIISISGVSGETGSYKINSEPSKTSELLEVCPQMLRFPIEPNKETTQCPVTLTNKMDHYVGVWIKPTNEQFTIGATIMEPHSTLVVSVAMKMHERPPQDKGKFEVLMIVVKSKRNLVKLESSIGGKLNIDHGFMALVEKLKAEVYRAVLTAITCDEPASCQIISRSTENMTPVTSIDVHPAKPWILTGHKGGDVSIWNYQKQETVMGKQVTKKPSDSAIANLIRKGSTCIKEKAATHWVCSAKFITRQKWLAVGDGSGDIHIYDYTDTKLPEVMKFKVHNSNSVDLLAFHPTETYLLSSSAYGKKIRLWDWSGISGWKEIQEYAVKPTYPDGVRSLKFNPRDTNTFACVTYDNRLKVGNINSSSLTTKLKGPFNADYFFHQSHQHLMVTLSSPHECTCVKCALPNCEIWDLKTGEIVHTLGVSGCKTRLVACHPRLPILVTALDDGTVCLWDARTYRLEKMVHITNSPACDLALFTDINDITRLVVTFESRIAIMEVNLPWENTGGQTGGGNYG